MIDTILKISGFIFLSYIFANIVIGIWAYYDYIRNEYDRINRDK